MIISKKLFAESSTKGKPKVYVYSATGHLPTHRIMGFF